MKPREILQRATFYSTDRIPYESAELRVVSTHGPHGTTPTRIVIEKLDGSDALGVERWTNADPSVEMVEYLLRLALDDLAGARERLERAETRLAVLTPDPDP